MKKLKLYLHCLVINMLLMLFWNKYEGLGFLKLTYKLILNSYACVAYENR